MCMNANGFLSSGVVSLFVCPQEAMLIALKMAWVNEFLI